MDETNTGGLRPINKIWGYFKWTLIGFIITNVLLVLSNLHLHIFLLRAFEWENGTVSESEGLLVDLHQGIIAIAMLAFMILSYIGYARFFQRSMFNARQIEPEEQTVSPVGMWLWNIVPIAALWMPFKGVRQVWDIMKTNAGEAQGYPAYFTVWWAFWVLSNIISNLTWRLPGAGFDFQLSAATYQDLLLVNMIDMITGGMAVISAIALYPIASNLARLQKGFTLDAPNRLKDVFA